MFDVCILPRGVPPVYECTAQGISVRSLVQDVAGTMVCDYFERGPARNVVSLDGNHEHVCRSCCRFTTAKLTHVRRIVPLGDEKIVLSCLRWIDEFLTRHHWRHAVCMTQLETH